MLAVSIFLSYLILAAANIMVCIEILDWLMKPRSRRRCEGAEPLWTC